VQVERTEPVGAIGICIVLVDERRCCCSSIDYLASATNKTLFKSSGKSANKMSASMERYRRVQEQNNNSSTEHFHDEDDEADDVIVKLPWRRQETPSFHRVATVDEEDPTPPAIPPSFSSASLDMEDEDAELDRYNLDFTEGTVERLRAELSAGSTLEERLEKGRLTLGIMWEVYCKARDETRRRRMERLLSLNSDWERFLVTVISYCDLTDRGMPVVMIMLAVWIAISVLVLSNPWTWTLLGILLFAVRVLLRLIYWYLWGRHVQRKRKLTLEKYAESNGLAMEMVPDFAVRKGTDFAIITSGPENCSLNRSPFDNEEEEQDGDDDDDEEDEEGEDEEGEEEDDKEPL
jgi:hypothetical protein